MPKAMGERDMMPYIRQHGFGAPFKMVRDRKKTFVLARLASIDGYMMSGDIDEFGVYYDPRNETKLPRPELASEPAIWTEGVGWSESALHGSQTPKLELTYEINNAWHDASGQRWRLFPFTPRQKKTASKKRGNTRPPTKPATRRSTKKYVTSKPKLSGGAPIGFGHQPIATREESPFANPYLNHFPQRWAGATPFRERRAGANFCYVTLKPGLRNGQRCYCPNGRMGTIQGEGLLRYCDLS